MPAAPTRVEPPTDGERNTAPSRLTPPAVLRGFFYMHPTAHRRHPARRGILISAQPLSSAGDFRRQFEGCARPLREVPPPPSAAAFFVPILPVGERPCHKKRPSAARSVPPPSGSRPAIGVFIITPPWGVPPTSVNAAQPSDGGFLYIPHAHRRHPRPQVAG